MNGSRRAIQARLHVVIVRELEAMRLPQHGPEAGRHLARTARALVHLSAELLLASVPAPVALAVMLEAMRKAIRDKAASSVVGAFGPVQPGKA